MLVDELVNALGSGNRNLKDLINQGIFSTKAIGIENPDDLISFSDINWGQSSENEPTALVGKQLTGIEYEE